MIVHEISSSYLKDVIQLFSYYRSLGEKAMEQVPEHQLCTSLSPESNSIAILVKHLHGNMKSRWTDFLHTDGEKKWRRRDNEFVEPPVSRQELLTIWKEGWSCLFTALESLKNEDLDQIVYIRNEGHLAMEAINRQLAHYSYHIGQIVFIAQALVGKNWVSLSIPKNKSKSFNKEKFRLSRKRKHFTQ